MTENTTENLRHKTVKTGVVVSDKMNKTVVVAVKERRAHKLYKKIVNRTIRFHAHDERSECGVGDTVQIVESRPLSRLKRWRVQKIVEKAK